MSTALTEEINLDNQQVLPETHFVKEIKSPGFFSTTVNLYGFTTTFKLPFKTFKVSGKKVGGKRHGIWQRYLDGYIFETMNYDQGRLVGLRQMKIRQLIPGLHEEYSGDVFHSGSGTSDLKKYYEFRDQFQININNNRLINASEIPLFGNILGHSFDHLTSLILKKQPKVFWSKVRSISQTNEYSFTQTKNELLNEELDGDDECIRHAGVIISLADRLIKLSRDENLSNYHQNKLLNKALFEIKTASLLADNTTDWLGLFLVTDSLPAKVREQKLKEYWSYFVEISGDSETFKDLDSLLKTIQNPYFNPATVELEKAFISGKWRELHVNEIFYLSQEMGLEVNTKNIDIGINELRKLGRLFHCLRREKGALPSLCSNLIKQKFNGQNEEKEDLFALYQLSLIFAGHLPKNFSKKVFKSWLKQQDSKISLKELFLVIKFPEFLKNSSGHKKNLLKKINRLDISSLELTLLISCPELNPLLSLLKDRLAEGPVQDIDEMMQFFYELERMHLAGFELTKDYSPDDIVDGAVRIREASEKLLLIWFNNILSLAKKLTKKFKRGDLKKLLRWLHAQSDSRSNSAFTSIFDELVLNIFLEVTKIDRKKWDKNADSTDEILNMLSSDENHYLELASYLWKIEATNCLGDRLFTHSYLTLTRLEMIFSLTSLDEKADKINLEVLWEELMSNYDSRTAELFTDFFGYEQSTWCVLISLLSGLKSSFSSPEFQLKVLSNEELPHVEYLHENLASLTDHARRNPPEGLEEILLTDLVFDCLEAVGVSTTGLDRNRVFSDIVTDISFSWGVDNPF